MSLDQVCFQLSHNIGVSPLKQVPPEAVRDRSDPVIEPGVHVNTVDKAPLLNEIAQGTALKHVETDDRSEPRVAGLTLQPSPRPSLLAEVKALGGHHAVVSELKAVSEGGGVALRQPEEVADRSAPAVEGAHVGKWDRGAFLSELEAPKQLRHVDQASDRSDPLVEPDVVIKPSPHGALMDELRASSPSLRHVEAPADRSSPRVSATAALRVRPEDR